MGGDSRAGAVSLGVGMRCGTARTVGLWSIAHTLTHMHLVMHWPWPVVPQVPLGLAATVRRHSTAVAGLDQLLPPFPELVQRMAAVEADCKEVRALAAAVRAQAAAAKADAADVRAGVADVRAQAAAANSPQVEELAAQIALLALGASGFHTTSSTRFQIQHSGSALVQCLSEQGVPNPAQRLGALVPGCAVDVCLSSLSQLRARVQRVQMFITPELRALEPFACHVVEHFEHIYTKCKGEGFKKKKKSWTGRRGLRHKAV